MSTQRVHGLSVHGTSWSLGMKSWDALRRIRKCFRTFVTFPCLNNQLLAEHSAA